MVNDIPAITATATATAMGNVSEPVARQVTRTEGSRRPPGQQRSPSFPGRGLHGPHGSSWAAVAGPGAAWGLPRRAVGGAVAALAWSLGPVRGAGEQQAARWRC